MNGVEVPPTLPSSSAFNENQATAMATEESRGKEIETHEEDAHGMCSDLNAAQDFVSGIMKIVPSDVDVSMVLHILRIQSLVNVFILFSGDKKKMIMNRINTLLIAKYIF